MSLPSPGQAGCEMKLNEKELADLRFRVGGKAAALIAAREAGLPVPPFFTLDVSEVLALSTGDEGSERVRKRLESEYALLGSVEVAVRSSAQAEDGRSSFAGQLTSRLGMTGTDEIARVVAEIAAGASSERVRSYAGATGVAAGDVAVIVQGMVPARVAGVAFSRDPLTYQPEVVVEAVSGLGESLVAGERTPSRSVIDRETLEPLISSLEGPVTAQLISLAAGLALECEALFGEAQDVEWAWDGERLWLLQSRPVTGFHDVEVFSDTWSSEVWPGLIKPLVFDVGDIAVNAAWGRILTSIAGRVDVDWRRMSAVAASRAYFNDTLLGQVLARAGLPENTLESVVRGERPRLREGSLPRLLASAGRLLGFLARNTRWLSTIDRDLPPLAARVADATTDIEQLAAEDLASRLEALLDMLEDAAYLSALTTISMGLRAALARLAVRMFAEDASAALGADAAAGTAPLQQLASVAQLIAALPETDRDIVRAGDLRLIEATLSATVPGRSVLEAMADLIERWGHIATVNTDFSTPAWRDEPEMLWRLAAVSRQVAEPADTTGVRPKNALGGAVIRSRLGALRQFTEAREEVNDVLALTYDALRKATRRAGTLLAPMVLDSPADIYYLGLEELLETLRGRPAEELRSVATQRAETLAADAEITPPHRLWALRLPPRDRLVTAARAEARSGEVLGGIPASPGVVTGTARVLGYSSSTDHLGRGDILIVGHIDVGWTPLFTVVGGVVTAVGGTLSHAAVVARELGVPAVVAVPDATALIPDGSLIRVDGSNGTVTLLGCREEHSDTIPQYS